MPRYVFRTGNKNLKVYQSLGGRKSSRRSGNNGCSGCVNLIFWMFIAYIVISFLAK